MGRTQSRWGVLALAIVACIAMGDNTAFAWNNEHSAPQPRVEAAGWFFTPNPLAPDGSARVAFGVTGRLNGPSKPPQGRFDYYNQTTGLRARGKITTLTFGTASPACLAFGDPGLAGKPAVVAEGQCDDGSCSFKMELVDANASPPKSTDYVCQVNVTGKNKLGIPQSDMDPAEPIIKGGVRIDTPTHHQHDDDDDDDHDDRDDHGHHH